MTPGGREFILEQGETILESALRSGLMPNYGCVNGTCGECKARVVSGDISEIRFHDYVIREREKRMGYALLCCTTALSDVVIEATEAESPSDIPVQAVTGRVHKLRRIGERITFLTVKVHRGRILRFLSGQYVTLTLSGLSPRSISIASCSCDGINLQFHVLHAPGDPFSEQVFNGLKKGDKVHLEGPYGRFTLDQTSLRPIIFIAYDIAFAPVNSLIEHAINLELPQPMHLYWYAPKRGDHYLHNYCRSWADALDDFSYTPLAGTGDARVAHRIGHTQPATRRLLSPDTVAEEVVRDHPDLSGFDVYMAGSERWLRPAKVILFTHGLPEERLFVDSLEQP